jgi:hypothetical protein
MLKQNMMAGGLEVQQAETGVVFVLAFFFKPQPLVMALVAPPFFGVLLLFWLFPSKCLSFVAAFLCKPVLPLWCGRTKIFTA